MREREKREREGVLNNLAQTGSETAKPHQTGTKKTPKPRTGA
jgi:hypothetical protein